MSYRSVLVVVLALIFGGSAAIGINTVLKAPPTKKAETVPVVVAATEVTRFSALREDQMTIREFPRDLVPPGAISSVQDAVGRVTAGLLIKDEPILDAKLAPRGAGRGMAAVIPKGMRAFTIQTPTVSAGVAGFILPGNKIDVLLTITGQGTHDQTGGGSSSTLLQNVEILAVDQRVEAPSDNKVDPAQLRSVTLLVTPDQASKLNLGQNKGTLHLSLRNPEDTEAARTSVATLADLRLFQGAAWDERLKGLLEASAKLLQKEKSRSVVPAVAEAAPVPPPQVRTLRGNVPGTVELR